jgi:hypothetical protein
MIWAGMTSDYLIGPYFFDGPVNMASYSAMFETWLEPQLGHMGLIADMWLQHNGAHVHFTLHVPDVLKEHFPGCWIGCDSPTSLAPLTWPPHSPNFTIPDDFCG